MDFNKFIQIGAHKLSESSSVFIIAEAGVNHGGDIAVAKRLVDVAAEAKADAVKFQAFHTESLILRDVDKAPYQKSTTEARETQFEMLKKLEMSREQNREIQAYCESRGILFLTTPFDETSLDELDGLNLPAYKVASTDLTNLPFLEKVARKNRPIFLSTGMSYMAEVEMALASIYPYNRDVILLQCSANYPVQDNEAHLRVVTTYRHHFDVLVGYSDHTVGIGAAPYAVPLGAKVIEKHFTLDKNLSGPDHLASLDPLEFQAFVATIRQVESFMGNSVKAPTLAETWTRASLQKSLVASRSIAKGEVFTLENLMAKRTGGRGISPIYFQALLGRPAPRAFARDEVVEP